MKELPQAAIYEDEERARFDRYVTYFFGNELPLRCRGKLLSSVSHIAITKWQQFEEWLSTPDAPLRNSNTRSA